MKFILALCCLAFAWDASAAQNNIVGYWHEPTGSVIQIKECGKDLCAVLVELSPAAPVKVDAQNPDRALRTRSLCGLQIGRGFHAAGANQAEGGKLYDPKSGRTYSGTMTAKGEQLELRGYVGLKLFGRSETWSRVQGAAPATCKA